jgi:squamous cell carcinoma antigen recognized by T-cells 3
VLLSVFTAVWHLPLLTILQEAGKLVLRTEPILFNNKTLQLSEEIQGGLSRSRPSAPPAKTGGLFVPRAAVSRPRAGLGQARKPGIGAKAVATATPSTGGTSRPQQGRGQDDFRKMLTGDR